MRRLILLVLGFASGCSNAPIAGLLDCTTNSRGHRTDGNRGPIVPEIRPPGQPSDALPPPAEVTPSIAPRP